MVTSSGAGIQPINAIRKAISVVSLGNIWVKGMGVCVFGIRKNNGGNCTNG